MPAFSLLFQYFSVKLKIYLVRRCGLCITSSDYPTGTLRVGGACALRLHSLAVLNREVLRSAPAVTTECGLQEFNF